MDTVFVEALWKWLNKMWAALTVIKMSNNIVSSLVYKSFCIWFEMCYDYCVNLVKASDNQTCCWNDKWINFGSEIHQFEFYTLWYSNRVFASFGQSRCLSQDSSFPCVFPQISPNSTQSFIALGLHQMTWWDTSLLPYPIRH